MLSALKFSASRYVCVWIIVGTCCSSVSQSMTRRLTLIVEFAFSKRDTSEVQYGWDLLLYWAITTLMVPDELLPDPPPLLLPPHAASVTAAAQAPARPGPAPGPSVFHVW